MALQTLLQIYEISKDFKEDFVHYSLKMYHVKKLSGFGNVSAVENRHTTLSQEGLCCARRFGVELRFVHSVSLL